MTVDTLSLAKELRAAELSPMQAEAIAAAIGRLIIQRSANKADVQLVRSDRSQVKAELETKVEQLRSNLTMWFIATNLTIAAIVIAANKL